MEAKIEKLIELAGNNHRYQYTMLILTLLIWINVDILPISLPFLEKVPDISFIDTDGRVVHSQLNYTLCESDNKIKYNVTQTYLYSWVIEYNIVCNRMATGLIGSICFLGSFISSFLFQYQATHFGRKKTVMINLILFCLILALFSLSINLSMIMALIFIAQLTPASVCLASYIHTCESVTSHKRSLFGAIINSGFCICGIVYIMLYKYLDDWRRVFLISSATTLLCGLVYCYYAIESPMFYIGKGNVKAFITTLKLIAKANGKEEEFSKKINEEEYQKIIDDLNEYYKEYKNKENKKNEKKNKFTENKSIDKSNETRTTKFTDSDVKTNLLSKNNSDQDRDLNLDQSESEGREITTDEEDKIINLSAYSLIKYPSQRYIFLISCFLWFSVCSNYYGLTIYSKHLPGDIYMNGILIYTSEMISYVVSGFFINFKSVGRTGAIITYYLIAIVGYMLLLFQNIPERYVLILFFMTRFAVAGVFNILYTYTCEIYPTVIRAQGFAFNSAIGKIGSILFPLLIEIFAQYVNLLFVAMNIICLCLMFFMPETLNKPLLNNIPEMEDKKNNCCNDKSENTENNENTHYTENTENEKEKICK